MGKRKRSLEYQLWNALESAYQPPYASKRAAARAHHGDIGARIYSNNYRGSLLAFGRDLAAFCRDRGARLLADITPGMVQAWLTSRGAVAPTTAETYRSYLRKLERVVNARYKTACWRLDGVTVPVDTSRVKARSRTMDAATLDALESALAASRAPSAARGVAFARITGARAREAASWVFRPDKITYEGGRWGFGTVVIGKEDGPKGGRQRVVSIQSAEDADALRDLVRGMQPGERVTSYSGRTPGASLDRAVTRTLAKVSDGQAWRQNAIHSIRKAWAQAVYNAAYDAARDAGAAPAVADRQACGVANQELGHSANRDDETAAYIGDARRSD